MGWKRGYHWCWQEERTAWSSLPPESEEQLLGLTFWVLFRWDQGLRLVPCCLDVYLNWHLKFFTLPASSYFPLLSSADMKKLFVWERWGQREKGKDHEGPGIYFQSWSEDEISWNFSASPGLWYSQFVCVPWLYRKSMRLTKRLCSGLGLWDPIVGSLAAILGSAPLRDS